MNTSMQDRRKRQPDAGLAACEPVRARRIAILAYDGANALDIFGISEPFARASEILGRGKPADLIFGDEWPYRLSIVAPSAGTVRMISGGHVVTEKLGEPDPADPIDTLIIPGGAGIVPWSVQDGTLAWMRRHSLAARRVCATGGGVFLLAAALLLEGRRAVTRWDVAATLEADYPETRVEHGTTFVRDGRFWTAAGSSSAVDVGLAMVEEDLGRGVAMRIARQLVVVNRRGADQPQISTLLRAQSVEEDIFDGLHQWIADNLGADLRLEQLAAHVGMSTRNFVRRYTEVVGSSPAKTVERMRVEAARQALEAGDGRIECIAHRFGFSSADVFRRVFLRHMGKAPREFRATCRETPVAA